MKTIELKRSDGDKRLFTLMKIDEGYGCMALCDIEDDNLILIGKRDFEKLLSNQRNLKWRMEDLPKGEKVMITNSTTTFAVRANGDWRLAIYIGNRCADIDSTHKAYEHIIPCTLFDYDNPGKWLGTENDYGLKGGAR